MVIIVREIIKYIVSEYMRECSGICFQLLFFVIYTDFFVIGFCGNLQKEVKLVIRYFFLVEGLMKKKKRKIKLYNEIIQEI